MKLKKIEGENQRKNFKRCKRKNRQLQLRSDFQIGFDYFETGR